MPSIKLSQVINKPIDVVYDLVCDMESYPRYIKNILSVQVLERSPGKTVTFWVTEVDGMKLTWQEVDEFFPEKWMIRCHRVKGDLERYESEWSLQACHKGTMLYLTIDFDLGIPLFTGLFQYLLVKKVTDYCHDILTRFKEIAEKDEKTFGSFQT